MILAFALWGVASHAFGAVQDVVADREAGISSIATVRGARWTVWFALSCYAAAGVAMLVTPWPGPLAALVPLLYIATVWPFRSITDETAERATHRLGALPVGQPDRGLPRDAAADLVLVPHELSERSPHAQNDEAHPGRGALRRSARVTASRLLTAEGDQPLHGLREPLVRLGEGGEVARLQRRLTIEDRLLSVLQRGLVRVGRRLGRLVGVGVSPGAGVSPGVGVGPGVGATSPSPASAPESPPNSASSASLRVSSKATSLPNATSTFCS